MFRTLADDPDSYLAKDAATFASAVGRSFYTQILPSNSVNLGWSSWAIQWLSRVPSPIPDHMQVAYSGDEDVRAAYAKQAAHDWHEFVAFRGRELCPGGRLVVMTMAVDDDGEFGYRPTVRRLARRARRTPGRRAGHRRGDAPDVHPDGRAQAGGLPHPVRAVGPFRAARDRASRGVRRRGPILDAVPKRQGRKGFRCAVGGVRPGVGVPDARGRARRRRRRARAVSVPGPAWRPASPRGWRPRRSRCRSRWRTWC